MASVWDGRRSMKQNMSLLGLANDANDAVKIGATRMSEPIAEPTKKEKSEKQKALHAKLEKAASNWDKKDWTVSQDDIHFAVHMLDTHHLDWKGMARDRKNHYQLTPAAIRHKVKNFWRDPVARQAYETDRAARGLEVLTMEF